MGSFDCVNASLRETFTSLDCITTLAGRSE
jgi:hypothetical protein